MRKGIKEETYCEDALCGPDPGTKATGKRFECNTQPCMTYSWQVGTPTPREGTG